MYSECVRACVSVCVVQCVRTCVRECVCSVVRACVCVRARLFGAFNSGVLAGMSIGFVISIAGVCMSNCVSVGALNCFVVMRFSAI